MKAYSEFVFKSFYYLPSFFFFFSEKYPSHYKCKYNYIYLSNTIYIVMEIVLWDNIMKDLMKDLIFMWKLF